MPRTKIIIDVLEELDTLQLRELRTVLGDAIHEFATGPRCDARAYVSRNYGEPRATDASFDPIKKIEQVERRVALAKLLHGPALNVRVELQACDSKCVMGHATPERDGPASEPCPGCNA